MPSVNWQACDLFAEGAGYSSHLVQMPQISGSGLVQADTLILHRNAALVAGGEAGTVSVVDLAAPESARKNLQKGYQQEKRKNWPAAQERFQKAVSDYPEYSQAWVELGRVQIQQGDTNAARQSFHAALEANPSCLDAYSELAQLAIRERQWKELAETTSHVVQLDPMAFPQFWYLNSVANFNLRQYDQAEKSDLRGIGLDQQHRYPIMEYLLGLIMGGKHDYRNAAQHVRNYLKMTPSSLHTAAIEQQLAQFEHLSGGAE